MTLKFHELFSYINLEQEQLKKMSVIKRLPHPTYPSITIVLYHPANRGFGIVKSDGHWGIIKSAVPPGLSFKKAAEKLLSDKGIKAKLIGILKIQREAEIEKADLNVIYLGELESAESFVQLQDSLVITWDEVSKFEISKSDLNWIEYIQNNGVIYPLTVLGSEGRRIDPTTQNQAFQLLSKYLV